MKTKAFAKVNLALNILGTRPDGKHDMDMVNARLTLHDTLDIEPIDAAQDEILCPAMKLPVINTLSQALDALRPYGLKNHYRIVLDKQIPEQAGLGGGSADAAALLQALNEMENLNLSLDELEKIGFTIGADVPCCLHEGFTRTQGAGERVQDLPSDWSFGILLVQGSSKVSTASAFAEYDRREPRQLDIDIVQDAVRKKDIGLLYQTMINAFELLAFETLEELEQVKEDMQDAGLVRVMMTGSGSCLMGFCVDDDVMDEAYDYLKERYPFVWKGRVGK